jgi:RHS repeat-associated protein
LASFCSTVFDSLRSNTCRCRAFSPADLDRIRTRTFPDGGVESFGYTANVSGPASYTNQLSKITTYAYDKLGRKKTEVIVGLSTNAFTFAPASDLLTLSDGKSQTTTWAYDIYGHVATKKYADGNTNLIYSYDASGRLTNRWSAAKGNTKYQYDANGNLTKIDYPSSADVTFAYDALNRSTNEVVASTFTNMFAYFPGGVVASEDGPWPSDTITYLTNTAGLRAGMTIQQPTGSFTNGYAYDAAHRLTNLTSTAGAFTYDYYSANAGYTASTRLLRKLTLPPGAYITNRFDNNARELETRLLSSTNVELNDHAYTYNVGNQRTQQTYTDDSYVSYSYDNAGELRTAYTTNSSGAEIAAQRYMFGYDAAWNMTRRTNNAAVNSYTYNILNENISLDVYDSNGNVTGAPNATGITYDDENRIIQILSTNSYKTDFTYDARGRLRKRLESTWNSVGGGWNSATETRYVYDGMLAVQERSSANTPQTTYTRGLDLSQSLQGAGGIGGLLARSTGYVSTNGAWGTHQYYHADGNGNVTYLMATNQTLAASYRYDPFGRTITSSGASANANTYRFSSKEIHANSSFYYYGYRFYDPNSQRWLNRDPIFEQADRNLYRMVRNAATFRVDPFGLADANCDAACNKAANDPNVSEGDQGGTICVNGKSCPCVFKKQGNISNSAWAIISDCILRHEQKHAKDHDEPCDPCKDNGKRGVFDPNKHPNAECEASMAQLDCLNAGRENCNGDSQCEAEVRKARQQAAHDVFKKCGGNPDNNWPVY